MVNHVKGINEKEIIRSHPNFVKEENGREFLLRSEKHLYKLAFRNASLNDRFILSWETKCGEPPYLGETEKWFKDLYRQVMEMYFEKNRVRMLVQGVRRNVGNIIYYFCLGYQNNEELKEILCFSENERSRSIDKEYLPYLHQLKEKLEKERYEVSLKEKNDKILFTIY